jgi:pyridoxine 5-phosphate synthase
MAIRLGVNIDHVATLRQLRGTPYPSLLEAADLVENAGADQITVHLREDRRHIQDQDVRDLKQSLKASGKIALNLEMAVTPEMVRIATRIRPDWVCLVPEKRRELTTEGGLDLGKIQKVAAAAISQLKKKGIRVSCFVEPSIESVELSHRLGADAVELHTGQFCLAAQGKFGARSQARQKKELARIEKAGLRAEALGLHAHAGHGFDYENVLDVVALRNSRNQPLFEEYNIGHAIVCRAVMVGLEKAVVEMRMLLNRS